MKLKTYNEKTELWEYQEISFWSFFKFYLISRLLFGLVLGAFVYLAFSLIMMLGMI